MTRLSLRISFFPHAYTYTQVCPEPFARERKVFITFGSPLQSWMFLRSLGQWLVERVGGGEKAWRGKIYFSTAEEVSKTNERSKNRSRRLSKMRHVCLGGTAVKLCENWPEFRKNHFLSSLRTTRDLPGSSRTFGLLLDVGCLLCILMCADLAFGGRT